MIILDTDVLSALMRVEPDPPVIGWLDRQARLSVWTTSVTVFEVRFGIALLPVGQRRSQLERAFERVLAEKIEERIMPFETTAAEKAAELMAERQRSGRTGPLRDTLIAGIAIAQHSALATRNTRHFADLPVTVVDPWAS